MTFAACLLILVGVTTYSHNLHSDTIEDKANSVVLLDMKASKGSGFFVEPNIIMTNNHVVASSDSTIVRFRDGRKIDGKVIARNDKIDLALVEISGEEWDNFENKPKPMDFCPDVNKLPLGTRVVTIGHPLLFDWIASEGIISRNNFVYSGGYAYYIVSDNKVYQGNSGGPMIKDTGCVVGISVQLFNQDGQIYSLSISGALVTDVYDRLRKNELDLPRFGAAFSTDDFVISKLGDESELKNAGLMEGDKIIQINDTIVRTLFDFVSTVIDIEKGEEYRIRVMRDNVLRTYTLVSQNRF